MEGTPRSFMWNRIKKLESAIEDRPKSAQAGREIAKFFFLKASFIDCSSRYYGRMNVNLTKPVQTGRKIVKFFFVKAISLETPKHPQHTREDTIPGTVPKRIRNVLDVWCYRKTICD